MITWRIKIMNAFEHANYCELTAKYLYREYGNIISVFKVGVLSKKILIIME